MKRFLKIKAVLCFVFAFVSVFTAICFNAVALDTVESVKIEKVVLIENYDGKISAEDDINYFKYEFSHLQATVTMSNGKKLTDDLAELEAYFGQTAVLTDSQTASTPWSVGTYKAGFEFLGFKGEFDVEIKENPVSRISVKDKEIYYLADGEENDKGVFCYDSSPDEMTVYFKDGSSVSGTAESFAQVTGYPVKVSDTQKSSPWEIGKHSCKVSYMGVGASYNVTVKKSDVKSIVVDDAVLFEGIDGEWNGAFSTFGYSAKPDKVTVFYDDGKALTGSVEQIMKSTGYKVSYSEKLPMNYGKNTAKATFMGVSATFNVTVKQNPIKSVQVIKQPKKTQYFAGELFDLSGAVIKVTYTDGKSEEVTIEQNLNSDCIEIRLEVIGKTVPLKSRVGIIEGASEVNIDFADSFFAVPIKVKEKKISSMVLSADENGHPLLKLNFSDTSKSSVAIKNAISGDFDKMKIGEKKNAIIVTDIGVFDVFIGKKLDGYYIALNTNEWEDELVSNCCDGLIWAESAMSEKSRVIYNSYASVDSYNGLVASDNIDKLLSFAAIGSKEGKPKEIHSDYMIYTATEIQKCIKSFFAIDGIDISCSDNYDSKSNTVKVFYDKNASAYETADVIYPVEYTFDGDFFQAVYNFTDGKKMNVSADKYGRIISYKVYGAAVHEHTMITVSGTAPTYIKTGLTDGVICSVCSEVLTEQKTIPKLVLGRTDKIVSKQNESAIKLTWLSVKGATGYEVYYYTSNGWRSCNTTTKNTVTFSKLPSGKKYIFALRAYVIESGRVVKAPTYTTFETSTQPKAPSKVISKQNETAIRLQWANSSGATGYRIYYKNSNGWKALGQTEKTVATFKNLKAGSRFTFAIRPYLLTKNGVVWGNFITYTAATAPAAPQVKAVSQSSGKITLSFSRVNGAQAYQIYYKAGNGNYKLYKNVTSAGTLNFNSVKKGSYTFAVRAAIRSDGGWIFGSYKPVVVTVK